MCNPIYCITAVNIYPISTLERILPPSGSDFHVYGVHLVLVYSLNDSTWDVNGNSVLYVPLDNT